MSSLISSVYHQTRAIASCVTRLVRLAPAQKRRTAPAASQVNICCKLDVFFLAGSVRQRRIQTLLKIQIGCWPLTAFLSFILFPFIDFSVHHQVVFWPFNRPACLAVHLVPLPTRSPISVKNAPRNVSCVWMPSTASAVETGFTCTTECVWWIVRGSCFLISRLTHERASS